MELRTIKNKQDYKEAINTIRDLMRSNPAINTTEAEKLDILITLVQEYEKNTFQFSKPDPIDAVLFRMEQQGLKPSDLIPFIGSKSKVSEVLTRKRPLSLSMIKALNIGLGIPAEILINQKTKIEENSNVDLNLNLFPIKEMVNRGYIQDIKNQSQAIIKEVLNQFLSPLISNQTYSTLLSRSYSVRSIKVMDKYSLFAWLARVINQAKQKEIDITFDHKNLTEDFIKKIVSVSSKNESIKEASKLLEDIGIILVFEKHMPSTYLDGAAIMLKDENPIIGMTARYYGLDNFWFTLIHELAHLYLHYNNGIKVFYDDIESVGDSDPKEKEADDFALNMMIPEDVWKRSPASIVPSPHAARLLAKKLQISEAIVAGRMRYARKHYHFLNELIGKGEVSKQLVNTDE